MRILLVLQFLLTIVFDRAQAYVYDLEFRDHTLDGAAQAELVTDIGALYTSQANGRTFVVDIPREEVNTSCVPQRDSGGSAHDATCNITSVTLGNSDARQVLATATIGDSGVNGEVCVSNGGFACAVAYFDSEPFALEAEDFIYYAWDAKTSGGENYYEFLVLLINATDESVVWGNGRRGLQSTGNLTYVVLSSGAYFLRFYVGGYLHNSDLTPRILEPDVTFTTVFIDTVASRAPTTSPSLGPTTSPSTSPSVSPSISPTTTPSASPSASPSTSPSDSPTSSPSTPSVSPTSNATTAPVPGPVQPALLAQPFETSILAIMIYTIAGILFLFFIGWSVLTLLRISRESYIGAGGIAENVEISELVEGFVERFQTGA